LPASIRTARATDAAALAALDRDAFGRDRPEAELAADLAHPDAVWGIAEDRDPIGFVELRAHPPDGELLNLAVARSLRRKGLGAALLRWGLDAVAEREVERVFLEVRVGNAAAIALYLGSGWEQVGIRRRYYRDGEDALVLMTALTPR
jgi:ribosomal-protein-alanine acetyltransferase